MEQREGNIIIRPLRAEEIECRIGIISEKGISLLLYKDARADMKILDEVCGPLNWQRSHEIIGGSLYCTVSIYDDNKGVWVSKSDVGTEGNTEREKSASSDSFKRSCVCWGIGRELYSAPYIWIAAGKTRIEKKQDNRGDRWICRDSFTVQSIVYSEDREIIGLVIINQDGRKVYELVPSNTGVGQQQRTPQNKKPAGAKSYDGSSEKTAAIYKEMLRTGIALDTVLARFGVAKIEDLSEADYAKALGGLKKTKSKAA